jgi:hypothetical protein
MKTQKFRGFIWGLLVFAAPHIGHTETANLSVDTVRIHNYDLAYSFDYDISYSLNTGDREFCSLALQRIGSQEPPLPNISYQCLIDERPYVIDLMSRHTQYGLQHDQEIVIRRMEPNQLFSGSFVIYSEDGPIDEAMITIRALFRGFDCNAWPPPGRQNANQIEIDWRTGAPRGIDEDDLVVIYSDAFTLVGTGH